MAKKTVRRAKVVTCSAIKANGEQCKQTRGLVNGLCASHRIAQPAGGADSLKNILDDISTNTPADGTTKFDLVNGMPAEVPVDVQADVLKKAEELGQEEERPVQDALDAFKEEGTLVALNTGYTFEEAAAILEQYKPLWEPYVPESSIQDIRVFASLVMDVVKMPYDDLVKEFMAVSVNINELIRKVDILIRDARYEYGDIPLDIRLDIDELNREIFQLKKWKGLLLGTIEFTNKSMDDKDSKKDDKQDKKPSKFAAFFGRAGKSILIFAALITLLAVLFIGEKKFNELPKNDVPPVVDNGPTNVDKGTEPAAPVTPGDVVEDVPVDDGAIVVPVPIDTYIVQSGDTLWDIAVKVYGDGSQWTKIYDANHNLINGDDARNLDDPGHWIHVGQVFNIPGQGGDI